MAIEITAKHVRHVNGYCLVYRQEAGGAEHVVRVDGDGRPLVVAGGPIGEAEAPDACQGGEKRCVVRCNDCKEPMLP